MILTVPIGSRLIENLRLQVPNECAVVADSELKCPVVFKWNVVKVER
jgi:hypothetical protein